MTDAAVMTSGASFVHASEHRGATDGHNAIVKMFCKCFAHVELYASHLHRREESSVGKLRQAFCLTADAGELLDVVVPRRHVSVTNRPVHGDPVPQIRFEVQVAPAIALATPGDGLAADLTAANPAEFGARRIAVGIVLVIDEELMRVFVASVITLALHELGARALGAIVPVAVFQLPNGNVLD